MQKMSVLHCYTTTELKEKCDFLQCLVKPKRDWNSLVSIDCLENWNMLCWGSRPSGKVAGHHQKTNATARARAKQDIKPTGP